MRVRTDGPPAGKLGGSVTQSCPRARDADVTASAEIADGGLWPSDGACIVVYMLLWPFPEIPALLAIMLAPPVLLWTWGRALEQLGVGVERAAVAAVVAQRALAAAREHRRGA